MDLATVQMVVVVHESEDKEEQSPREVTAGSKQDVQQEQQQEQEQEQEQEHHHEQEEEQEQQEEEEEQQQQEQQHHHEQEEEQEQQQRQQQQEELQQHNHEQQEQEQQQEELQQHNHEQQEQLREEEPKEIESNRIELIKEEAKEKEEEEEEEKAEGVQLATPTSSTSSLGEQTTPEIRQSQDEQSIVELESIDALDNEDEGTDSLSSGFTTPVPSPRVFDSKDDTLENGAQESETEKSLLESTDEKAIDSNEVVCDDGKKEEGTRKKTRKHKQRTTTISEEKLSRKRKDKTGKDKEKERRERRERKERGEKGEKKERGEKRGDKDEKTGDKTERKEKEDKLEKSERKEKGERKERRKSNKESRISASTPLIVTTIAPSGRIKKSESETAIQKSEGEATTESTEKSRRLKDLRNLSVVELKRSEISVLRLKKLMDPAVLEQAKKVTMEEAITLFNGPNPKKAIDFMIKNKLVEGTANAVAAFLHTSSELSKEKIGEYLGEREDFAIATLDRFVGQVDFTGAEFDKGLRMLLAKFRLPGESQKIERIMESFAKHYYNYNKGHPFEDSDCVFILAYSVIMLNTDAHNPQVKNKMTVEQFLSNNRGINAGKDLPPSYLDDLYHRIVDEEIKTKDDDAFPDAIKKGWLMIESKGMMKKNKKRRWFVLNDNHLLYQFKLPKDEGVQPPVGQFILSQGVTIEKKDEEENSKSEGTDFSFALYETITPEETTEAVISGSWKLVAPSARAREEWIAAVGKNNTVVLTPTPPTIGIKMDEDEVEISQLHERVKSAQGCVSTVINGFSVQLDTQELYNDSFKRLASSLESSAATLKKEKTVNMSLCDTLQLSASLLSTIGGLQKMLYAAVSSDIKTPLNDLIAYDIGATKLEVNTFTEVKSSFKAIEDELQREIKEQSRKNAANPVKFQKVYKKHHDTDEELKYQRQRTIETLTDTRIAMEAQLLHSVESMIEIYAQFFMDGVELVKEVESKMIEARTLREEEMAKQTTIDSTRGGLTPTPSSSSIRSIGSRLRLSPSGSEPTLVKPSPSVDGSTSLLANSMESSNIGSIPPLPSLAPSASTPSLSTPLSSTPPSSTPLSATPPSTSSTPTSTPPIPPSPLVPHIHSPPATTFTMSLPSSVSSSISASGTLTIPSSMLASGTLTIPSMHLNISDTQHSSCDVSPISSPRRKARLVDQWAIIRKGTLLKKGGKHWTSLYCVLKRKYLFYMDENVKDLKGVIQLRNCSIEPVQTNRDHSFVIIGKLKVNYLAAPSSLELDEWINHIRDCIVNDPDFKPRKIADVLKEEDFIEDALTKQKELVMSKQKEIAKAKMRERYSLLKSPSQEHERRGTRIFGLKPSETNVSSFIEAIDNTDTILKEGSLSKRGEKVKNWKTRWFVLKNGSMQIKYYEGTSPSENTLKGTMDIRRAAVEVCTASWAKKKPNCFEIRCTYRTYFICASNQNEMKEWMDAIRGLIEEDNKKLSSSSISSHPSTN